MKRAFPLFVGLGLAAGLVLLVPAALEAYGPANFAVGPLECDSGVCTLVLSNDLLVDGDVRAKASGKFHMNGRAEWSSPSDGKSVYCNDARSTCYCVDHTVADTATFYAGDCSSAGGVNVTGALDVTGALTAGSLSLSGDLDLAGNDAKNLNDLFADAVASDAAARVTVLSTQPPYEAIGATNNDGGNFALIPASGANDITGVTYGDIGEGATVTITAIDMSGGVNTTVLVEDDTDLLLEFNCSGASSDIECVCLIYDAALRNATAGKYSVLRTDGTCSDEKLLIYPTVGTSVYVSVVSSDTDIALTRGTDGLVLVPLGSATVPSITTPANSNTGISLPGGNVVRLICGGVSCVVVSSTTATFNVNTDTLANYSYSSNGPYEIGGNCTTGGTGDWCSSGAGAVGGTLAVTGQISGSSSVRAGSASSFFWTGRGSIKAWSTNDILLSDSAGTGFDALLLSPARATDAAPSDVSLLGPNAYSQATGGNVTGGAISLGGGLGMNKVVCDNFAWASGDIVTLTVDGADTPLTEGVEFNAGADDELTCDDFGSAVTTAAIGITPDCATVGGTCFFTFDADIDFFDMAIADGGADGVFATLTESEDGEIIFPLGSEAAPSIVWVGDPDTGFYHDGANSVRFGAGGSLAMIFGTSTSMYVNLNMRNKSIISTTGTIDISENTTYTLAADDKVYVDATSTGHTQTAGVLDINMSVADGTAGGQVAIDVSSTTPAEGLGAGETQYAISASITGDGDDNATSVHIVNQVAYTPNGGGGTSYGYYAADTDFDYGFYTTANSEFAAMTINGVITVPTYDVDYVISAGSAGLGPTAPTWTANDSCHGLTFDADAELAHLTYEIPDCYADGASDDLVLRIYWCAEDGQNPAQNDVVKWDVSYRALIWGTDDVDFEAAITDSVSYTEAANPGDEGDTHVSSITLDADAATQALDAGDTLSINFDRDWSVGSNYAHDAIVQWWEIQVPQTKLKCDHY